MNKKKLIIISSLIVILCVVIGIFQHFYNSSKNLNETTVISSITNELQESENSESQNSQTTQNETEVTNEEENTKNNNKANANNSNSNATINKNQKPNAGSFPQQNDNPVENKPNHNSGNNNTTEKKEISVTLTISCKNALKYNVKVPSSGYFLNGTRYNVKNGATVFDVLSNACKENGIKLDYDGSYITGIGGLYEKQCTDDSGWMYRVNGKLPPKAMKNYTLKDGDKIEVYYVTSYQDMP